MCSSQERREYVVYATDDYAAEPTLRPTLTVTYTE